jgi:molybdopterin/thiamine biosynthesis adenylyltransferase/rhodanese-related sulfurtransferase
VTSARDHLAAARAQIREQTAGEAAERLNATPPPALLDVRERDEYEQGFIPGAIHIPRGNLETRIERNVVDRSTPVIVYCATGTRSAYAAKTLAELGYTDVVSMSGGFASWKENGHEWKLPRTLSHEQWERYSRHVLIPEVGEEGQLRLLDSKVLLIGAGGLGSPAALYLAAAGIGTIGVIDADVVDTSNLQRQIVHSVERVGMAKVDSAEIAIKAINPEVNVVKYTERLTSENVLDVIGGYDVIVDGTDNFPTRYLLNDASLVAGIPVVHGSIYQFEGSVTMYKPFDGPCYRCQYPEPPPPELAPSCAEGGVLGVLPGVIGTLQATEAVKLVLGIGEPLVGRQIRYDALTMEFVELKMRRDPHCPVCSKDPSEIEFIDYEQFCALPSRAVVAGEAA